jgi:hypothetical protein
MMVQGGGQPGCIELIDSHGKKVGHANRQGTSYAVFPLAAFDPAELQRETASKLDALFSS